MKIKLEQALKRIDMRYYIPISPQQFIDAAYYNTLLADARLVAEQLKMLKELWAQGIEDGGPDVNGDYEICIYSHDKEPQLSRAKSFEDCISIAYAEMKKRKIAMR